MPSDDLIRKLIDGAYLKRQPKSSGQARKLLARALKDLRTAKATLEIDEEAAQTKPVHL